MRFICPSTGLRNILRFMERLPSMMVTNGLSFLTVIQKYTPHGVLTGQMGYSCHLKATMWRSAIV